MRRIFHLDAGRLCVLLSRHRVDCSIFGREGISRQFRRYAPKGDHSLGISADPEFEDWYANMSLLHELNWHRPSIECRRKTRWIAQGSAAAKTATEL